MIYCLGCSYCLEGLSNHRCPECGRGFDPLNPATFAINPGHIRARRPGSRLLSFAIIGLVLFFLTFVHPSGGLYFLAIGSLLQTCVVLVGLCSAVFGSSRASVRLCVAIAIGVLQLGATLLLIAAARMLFSFPIG